MRQVAALRLRAPAAPARVSLCDALDTLLDTGIVARGEIRIKVADVDLLYIALELVACSAEKAGITGDDVPASAVSAERPRRGST